MRGAKRQSSGGNGAAKAPDEFVSSAQESVPRAPVAVSVTVSFGWKPHPQRKPGRRTGAGAARSASGAAGQNVMAGCPGLAGGAIGGQIRAGFSVMKRQGGQGTAFVGAVPAAGRQAGGQGTVLGAPGTRGGQAHGGLGTTVSRAWHGGGTREGRLDGTGRGTGVTERDAGEAMPLLAMLQDRAADAREDVGAFTPLVGAVLIGAPTSSTTRSQKTTFSFVMTKGVAERLPGNNARRPRSERQTKKTPGF